MALSRKVKILIGAVALVQIALIVAGINYRQNWNRDFQLVSGEFFGGAAVHNVNYEPSFPTNYGNVELRGIQAASTGEVYERILKDEETGELLGVATILKTVTRERDALNILKRISFIVQFVSATNTDRNILPWVLGRAATLNKEAALPSRTLTPEEVSQILPRGTIWVFVPLVDLTLDELSQTIEYSYYSRRYFGGSIYPNLNRLFRKSPDSIDLLGKASIPIPLLDIESKFVFPER